MRKITLLSLGGSLVVPGKIDERFLADFCNIIRRNLKKSRFIIVVGGGKISRNFMDAARRMGVAKSEDLDWLGIYASRLNAQLVRTLFGANAEDDIAQAQSGPAKLSRPILVAAATSPGWSTDFVATALAQKYKIKRLINLTDTSHVYDRDPKAHADARPISRLDWMSFRKIVGRRWTPGLSKPFDPIASKLAQKLGLEVVIADGRDMKNLQNILSGKVFEGSTIFGK